MTIAPNNPDHKSSNESDKEELINNDDSSLSGQSKEKRANISLGNCFTYVGNYLKSPALGEWLKSSASVSLVALIATVLWNWQTAYNTTKRYNSDLVINYINSIKELILDQYHHGKEAKFPEISVEEVEAFIRAKTSNTLKALDKGNRQWWWLPNQAIEKQNLINFLSEAGIGFFPPYRVEGVYSNQNIIQNVCQDNGSLVDHHKYQSKDYKFHHFFCGINLQEVNFENVDLTRIILEKANLKDAVLRDTKLWQADLQGAFLNGVELNNTDLSQANLKQAMILGSLDNAKLNRANLRGVRLWSPRTCEEDNYIRQPNQPNFAECIDYQQEKYTKSSLKGAKMLGTNLKDAVLRDVDLSNAKMGESLEFRGLSEDNQIVIKRRIPTNLRNADLTQAILEGTDLRVANLRGANLTDVPMPSSIQLEKAIFDRTTVLPSWLQEQYIKIMINVSGDKDLINEDLSYVDLRYAFLCQDKTNQNKQLQCNTKVSFKGTDFTGSDLRGADLSVTQNGDKEYQIDYKKLQGALFDQDTKLPFFGSRKEQESQALSNGMVKLPQENPIENLDLRKVDLKYVDLSGVNLSGAKLQGADLRAIDFDRDTKFTNAQYIAEINNKKCYQEATHLPFDRDTAVYYGMRLVINLDCLDEPIDLQKADLRRSTLTSNNGDLNLTNANLQATDLRDADWQKANLTNANLTDVKLQGANLTDAKLQGADLTNGNLKGATVTPEQLAEATLCNTILTDGEVATRDCNKLNSDKPLRVSVSYQE